MNPVALSIGPVALRWYGIMIVGGTVLAAVVANIEAKRRGEDPDYVWNMLIWVLVFGIIGARIYHVFSSPADGVGFAYYKEHPLEAINPFGGAGFGFRGLGIFGAVVGGVFALWLYTQVIVKPRLNLLRWLDIVAPGVLLAQAVGRFGNFINQELYGPAVDAVWAFHINPRFPCQVPEELPANIQYCGSANLTPETMTWYSTHGFHPTFFYEAGWNLVMFFLLLFLARRLGTRLKAGDIFLGYMIAYPMGRFWVEMFRPDAWVMGQLATAQWISIVSVVFAVAVLILRHRRRTATGPSSGSPAEHKESP